MGWKNVKEHYRIEHIIRVEDGEICIGSPYIYDIIRLGSDGSILKPYRDGSSVNVDLARYMQEFEADPEKLRQLVEAPDVFERSITVFTYKEGVVLEKQCEELGWPNITHDGELMYENTFSEDKIQVIRWAEKDLHYSIKEASKKLKEASKKLKKIQKQLSDLKSKKAEFEENYGVPDHGSN